MLVFPQMDPMNSHGFLFTRFNPRGPPAFKMEMGQQERQEEEIPIRAMAALKISRKHHPRWHHPYDLPTWGQIKTLTNRAENVVSQQGLSRSPEHILRATPTLSACTSPARARTDTQPPSVTGGRVDREDQSLQLSTLSICFLPSTGKSPHTLGRKED